jgi:hydrogenase expression/formation protein HypE
VSDDRSQKIGLRHGGGGEEMRALISGEIQSRFDNEYMRALGDSARLSLPGVTEISFTTDSYVVDPPFFPGGDIGRLAVCGTVNDLAVSGAEPRWISCGLIIEEGLPLADLRRVLDSMAAAAHEAGVELVTGDTKVVPRGGADRIFINTAGIGPRVAGSDISIANCRPGDMLLVSGPVGTHGAAILLARDSYGIEADLESDVAPLASQVKALLDACPETHFMRDPTRGGLAGILTEITEAAGVGIELDEPSVPVLDPVRSVCELLGFDPLYLANEGIFLAVVPEQDAERGVEALRAAGAEQAAVIGSVVEDELRIIDVRTEIGGQRILPPPGGELLPRIC